MSPKVKFELNDVVCLTAEAIKKYGLAPNQGMGGPGRIVHAMPRDIDATRPYLVRWRSDPSGVPNSYQEVDLLLAGARAEAVSSGPGNIAFFNPSRRSE